MQEFLNMGGYAFYVWSSFGLTFLVLLWNILSPSLQHKAALQRADDFYSDDDE